MSYRPKLLYRPPAIQSHRVNTTDNTTNRAIGSKPIVLPTPDKKFTMADIMNDYNIPATRQYKHNDHNAVVIKQAIRNQSKAEQMANKKELTGGYVITNNKVGDPNLSNDVTVEQNPVLVEKEKDLDQVKNIIQRIGATRLTDDAKKKLYEETYNKYLLPILYKYPNVKDPETGKVLDQESILKLFPPESIIQEAVINPIPDAPPMTTEKPKGRKNLVKAGAGFIQSSALNPIEERDISQAVKHEAEMEEKYNEKLQHGAELENKLKSRKVIVDESIKQKNKKDLSNVLDKKLKKIYDKKQAQQNQIDNENLLAKFENKKPKLVKQKKVMVKTLKDNESSPNFEAIAREDYPAENFKPDHRIIPEPKKKKNEIKVDIEEVLKPKVKTFGEKKKEIKEKLMKKAEGMNTKIMSTVGSFVHSHLTQLIEKNPPKVQKKVATRISEYKSNDLKNQTKIRVDVKKLYDLIKETYGISGEETTSLIKNEARSMVQKK